MKALAMAVCALLLAGLLDVACPKLAEIKEKALYGEDVEP